MKIDGLKKLIKEAVREAIQEEYEFCVQWDAKEAWSCLHNVGNGRWLNTNVYSECEHDERQLRMEQGI